MYMCLVRNTFEHFNVFTVQNPTQAIMLKQQQQQQQQQ